MPAQGGSAPDLDFRVASAEILEFAAAPTLLFKLQIENRTSEAVRSIMLRTQIRIVSVQRHYNSEEQEGLHEVFGKTLRGAETLRSLLWTHTILLIPPFTDSVTVDMPVPCTYDFDVASTKYFDALEEGLIPLEFLFSGTIFYASERGLQVTQISWEKDASYRMPVALWQQMMEHYFPNSSWLRLRKDVFDRLYRYKVQKGLATWEDALDRLLAAGPEEA